MWKWPNAELIQEVQEAFHGGSYQQQVLFTNMGYNYLDVRPVTELDDIGRVKGAVHIPKAISTYLDVQPVTELYDIGRNKGAVHIPKTHVKRVYRPEEGKKTNVKRVYSPEEGKKVDKAEPNDKFLEQVTKMFPDKEAALLLVADSTGALDGPAIKVLEMLEDEGYENLVGMQGGYAGWNEVWDRKLARRAPKGAYVEDPWAPGASQGGILELDARSISGRG
eukprot:gene3229-13252_t